MCAKRVFDLVGFCLLLPVCLPVMAALALGLVCSGGPVFHAQIRVGQGGRPFRMWKFRSMCPAAAAALPAILSGDPRRAREWAAAAKLSADPRVTRAGRWMRRYGLDELPQLWNVARGEMSLVGPRPVPPEELAERYGPAAAAYCAGRPGMTGPWQVSPRNRVDYAGRVALDLCYRGREGAGADLAILARTVAVVLRGRVDVNFDLAPRAPCARLCADIKDGGEARAEAGHRSSRRGRSDPAPVRG